MESAEVIGESMGNWDKYCEGFGGSGTSGKGYVCAVTLKVGKAPLAFGHRGSAVLDEKNVFDVAETDGAYLGQINMMTASSFCGPMGRIWGHTFPKVPELRSRENLLFDAGKVPTYDAAPLVEASQELLGTRLERHFPIVPGSLVPCAEASVQMAGPIELYAAIGIGVVADESRERAATLFMEDVGQLSGEREGKAFRTTIGLVRNKMAKAMMQVGRNQHVKYKEFFVSAKSMRVGRGEMGCALAAVPYLKLARRAVPKGRPELLGRATLEDWRNQVGGDFLSRSRMSRQEKG